MQRIAQFFKVSEENFMNAMKEDFSWNKSAKRYAEIYKSI